MKPSVLITGASAGIGAATARLLSERGFDVFGTSRQPEALGSDRPAIHWVLRDLPNISNSSRTTLRTNNICDSSRRAKSSRNSSKRWFSRSYRASEVCKVGAND